MSALPKGWVDTKLGVVVSYAKTTKIAPRNIQSDEWVLELEDIEKGTSKLLQRVTFSDRKSKSTKNRFKAGDVLYGKLRPYLDKVLIATESGYCSTEIIPISPGNNLDGRYLYYSLRSKEFLDYVTEISHGLNMPRLGTKAGQAAPFKLAPLNEQKRIADKLDRLLAKVDAAKTRLDKTPAFLKRFRQSVLAAAISGKMTEESNRDAGNYYSDISSVVAPTGNSKVVKDLDNEEVRIAKEHFGNVNWQGWTLFPLEQLVDKDRGIPYGIVQTGKHYQGGIRTVRCGDIKPLRIDMSDLKLVDPSIDASYSRTKLKGGEVILAIRGTVGNAAVVPEEMAGANISREVALIPVLDNIEAGYIAMLLQSPGGYRCMAERVKGVAQRGINLADIRRLVVPLPSQEEQKEIVRRVEDILTIADRIEGQYKATRVRVDKLNQSLLAKAFRGELAPQDPNDEPAQQLLERIRSQREVEKAASKVRRIPAKSARKARGSKVAKKATVKRKPKKAKVVEVPTLASSDTGKDVPHAISERAAELFSVVRERFGAEPFAVDQLREHVAWGYEDLKGALFELIKGDRHSNLRPMLNMQWDGGYRLRMASKL